MLLRYLLLFVISSTAFAGERARHADRTVFTYDAPRAIIKQERSRAASLWTKAAQRYYSPESICVAGSDGKMVRINPDYLGYFASLIRWSKTRTSPSLLQVRTHTAQEIEQAHDFVALHAHVPQKSLQHRSSEQLAQMYPDLEYFQAPPTVMKAVAQTLVNSPVASDVPLSIELCDLLNAYYPQSASTLTALAVEASKHQQLTQRINYNKTRCDLSHLELEQLDGLQHIADTVTAGSLNRKTNRITELDLSHNSICQVTASDIRKMRRLFPHLRTLKLTGNTIEQLEQETLSALQGLQVDLNNNPLDLAIDTLAQQHNLQLNVRNTPTAQKQFDYDHWYRTTNPGNQTIWISHSPDTSLGAQIQQLLGKKSPSAPCVVHV